MAIHESQTLLWLQVMGSALDAERRAHAAGELATRKASLAATASVAASRERQALAESELLAVKATCAQEVAEEKDRTRAVLRQLDVERTKLAKSACVAVCASLSAVPR